MPIIPISHQFISADRVFLRTSYDLKPHFYALPRTYGEHDEFLMLLGVRDAPVLADYIALIQEIHENIDEELSLNDLQVHIPWYRISMNM